MKPSNYLELINCPFCQCQEATMELQQIQVSQSFIWGYKCKCGSIIFLKKEVEDFVNKTESQIIELENKIDDLEG